MWPGYKNGSGIDPVLLRQFDLLEEALGCLGVPVWAMVDLEADDALASAAAVAGSDPEVDQVLICTPDKDLAQCVQGNRVVQFDRRRQVVVDEDGVRAKFGVEPESIPDYLALVGDSADGYPGLLGWGARSTAAVLARYRHLEAIPDEPGRWDVPIRGVMKLASTLAASRELATHFRDLATLRVEPPVISSVDELLWGGPTADFAALCERTLEMPSLAERAGRLARRLG
jgi:5'-3' exonuclease